MVVKVNTDLLFLLCLGSTAVLGWFAGLSAAVVKPHAESFWARKAADRSMPCASLHSAQVSGSELSPK